MNNVYFCKTGCREKITGVYFRKNELTEKSFRVYFQRAVQGYSWIFIELSLNLCFERNSLSNTNMASILSAAPKAIPFSDIQGVQVGNAWNDNAKTGVTVFYFPHPATAAVKILGGGPASRETPLLEPERNSLPLNTLVFGGGSAYGLAAADGVMRRMEEIGAGFDTGFGIVPIVCQSGIFDLSYGDGAVRPDRDMGYLAASRAVDGNDPRSGNVGAGTGATLGKPYGMARAQKSGIGYAACRVGDLRVGVAAVVNAMGDVYEDGKKIAGLLTEDRKCFASAEDAVISMGPAGGVPGAASGTTNTTLAAVFTNANLDLPSLKKVTAMASCGMSRAIRPVFTMWDGDTIYAVSVGSSKVPAEINAVGALAARVMESAIADAVRSSAISESEYISNI